MNIGRSFGIPPLFLNCFCSFYHKSRLTLPGCDCLTYSADERLPQDALFEGPGFEIHIWRRGFALLRGLPVADYSEREAATIFYGLGTHLGHARSQNAQGHVFGHVRNSGVDSSDPNVRIYQTKERQSFHTDSCDVVGLLCLNLPGKEDCPFW
jgi:hypothetical protein